MGSNISTLDVKEKVKSIFNNTASEEISQKIDVIMEGGNELILEGYTNIEGININQTVLIKNQVMADIIVDSAKKYHMEDNIIGEIENQQSNGDGIFQLNVACKRLKQELEKYMNITDISKHLQEIRNNFSVSNKIKIINNKLETTGSIKNLNINQTTEQYNEAAYRYLYNKLSEYENKSQISSLTKDTQEGADLKPVMIVAVIVAGILAYNLLKD